MSEIKLYNGNCESVLGRVLENLDMDKVVFVSDPPFNIGYHYKTYKDKMKHEKYMEMLKSVFSVKKKVIIHYPEQLHQFSLEIGQAPVNVVSWVYNSNTAKQHRDIAFYGIKPDFRKVGQPYKNPTDKRIAKRIAEGKKARLYDWWNINQIKNVSKEKTAHPCQMPIEVMDRIIGILPDDCVVVDPFMGSGTTGVSCKRLERDFIGIELDEDYYDIARERIKK